MKRAPSVAPELPGYRFVRLLGSGGFSDVFLYDQQLPRRKVAVKVLLAENLDESTRARFVAEANVMAQLSTHPFIVTIHHADVAADARPYFVMEYCSGPSLADRYKREVFSVEDALRTGVRLSSAIATAHSVGILHRDVKPANVLTNDYGWPALTDFGISSALEEELPVHTTSLRELRRQAPELESSGSRAVGLSVPWSPPEMFEDEPRPDVRSDVFSLAATIHTLLAGRTPFEIPGRSNGSLDLIGRIERGAITRLERTDVPPTLIAVLQKGMATDRADRFGSAVDFARALQRVELELGYAPTGIDVPHLTVAAQHRTDDEPEDETRARSVVTVEAQKPPPVRIEVPPQAPKDLDVTQRRGTVPVVFQAPPEEQTVVRPPAVTAVQAPSDPAPAAASAPASAVVRSRRPLFLGIAGVAVLAVVVGAGVLVSTLLPTSAVAPTASNGAGNPGGGGIDVSVVPDAELVSAKVATDGSVDFVWKNPKPKPGDQYQWVLEGTTDPPTVTARPQATVSGLAPGARVCIDVTVIRDGRTSANTLKACSS
ncbi:MAG: serine/threonine-protein kinase [Leifsonia sp.]